MECFFEKTLKKEFLILLNRKQRGERILLHLQTAQTAFLIIILS
ncbi:hypothetical protein J2W50_000136 [Herbaspirillum frisingense]|uniref:Uncharacterized protein n=1 Tax=Herbaspirillum frisingense TaxID=92645 RepID=A0ABU1P7S5_9BURK|nr:hypothetical protein [Herbaspirillum frisingense]